MLAADIAQWIPGVLGKSGVYHLTDDVNPTQRELALHLANQLQVSPPRSLPEGLLRFTANTMGNLPGFPLTPQRFEKLTQTLTFSCEKAKRELGWNPRPVVPNLHLK